MTIAETLIAELHKKPQELLKECIENSVRVITNSFQTKYFLFKDNSYLVKYDNTVSQAFRVANPEENMYYLGRTKTIAEHFSR